MENRLEKRCRICGDKALSFNFNGLCCESCKIFFRRNAFNLQNLKCYLNNNCPITKDTRTKCKLCRLNKCFDIGMKKELIVFRINNEHKSDKQKVYNNKSGELFNILKSSTQSCQKSTDLIAVRNISNSKCDNILTQNTETPELLTYYESHCLELIKKVTISFNEEPPVGVPILGYSTSLINVFNSQLAHLPLMLSFANSIAPFRTLPQNQQLPIFKTAFPQILLLRSAYYFNFDKNAFLLRSNQSGDAAFYVKLDTIYPGENSHEAIDLHRKVAFMVRCEIEGDTFLRDLMSILLLFNSKSQIDNPEYIRYQYFSYCHILRKYLSNKYTTNPRKASQKYLKLMEIIENIEAMTEHAQKHWIAHAVATEQISDVLAEIYSLKNC